MNKLVRLVVYKLTLTVPILLMLMGGVELRDPTKPPDAPGVTSVTGSSSAEASGTVTAIFDYPDHRVAIVDNRVVQQGDRIGEFTITAITPYTVELAGTNNSKQVLELVSTIKKTAN